MTYDPYLAEVDKQRAKETGQVEVAPTAAQQAWLDLQGGLFVHYGINTFNDAEWSDGTLPLSSVDPDGFEPAQWVSSAKAAGLGYVLLVTKHHDGFCNWPTDTTDYHAGNTPLGQDVVAAVADACRAQGLALGLYYSLWDRHAPCYDHDAGYALYMKRHLAELLTRYGPIVELWFDGGWKKGGVHYQDADRWHWRELYELIHAIQPDCLVANNGTSQRCGELITWPCDLRLGEKKLPPQDDRKVWYCGGIGSYLPYEACFTLSRGGTGKGMFAGGKWFWHADDQTCQDPRQVARQWATCNERGANFVLNAGPGPAGRLREIDTECLQAIGQLRRA